MSVRAKSIDRHAWPHVRPSRCALTIAVSLILPVAVAKEAPRPSQPAGSIVVQNCDDSGPGSLRDTIAGAASGDMIDLSELTCSTITLTSGAIEIPQDDLYIKYSGEGGTPPSVDGNLSGRVFHHTGTGTLKLVGLTITHGKYDNADAYYVTSATGGCIYSAGSVYLAGSTVTACTARDTRGEDAAGGAVYASGSLTLDHATLSSSTAYSSSRFADGGGAFAHGAVYASYSEIGANSTSGLLGGFGGGLAVVNAAATESTIASSTIDGNTAQQDGGGLFVSGIGNSGSALSLANSTISGNTVTAGYAAAAYVLGPLEITASTVAFNDSSGVALALGSAAYPVAIDSSILADNHAGTFDDDIGAYGGTLTITGSHDLIIDAEPSIVLPGDTIGAEPLLDPLADNGGATRTHALADGSPALDAGDNDAGLSFDQRGNGFARVAGTAADIGAFERQASTDTIFADGFDGGMREADGAVR